MTTNRRQFLQIGLAASTWPLAARAAHAVGVAAGEHASTVRLYKVVYDTRFEASVAFARRAAALGAATQAIDGDMTRFWYQDLHHRWRKGPAAIAGLTAHGPLFCFEQLAQDQRMRVVFRAEHQAVANGRVAHAMTGPVELLELGARLDSRWPERMAELVARCPAGRAEIAAASATGAAGIGAVPEPLYSWVIAPATKA